MSNRVIYTIIENGKKEYLYGQRAASYISAKQEAENGIVGFNEAVEQHLEVMLTYALIEQDRGEEQRQSAAAVVEVIEGGNTHWMKSDHAGSYNGAVTILKDIDALMRRRTLDWSATECAKALRYDFRYGGDIATEEGKVLCEITVEEAEKLLQSGQPPVKISLDFDNEIISIAGSQGDKRTSVAVSFGDALQCMEWAQADFYDEYDGAERIESTLKDYLENYVPHQESGPKMNY